MKLTRFSRHATAAEVKPDICAGFYRQESKRSWNEATDKPTTDPRSAGGRLQVPCSSHVVIEGVISLETALNHSKGGLEMNSKPSKTASVDETA